MAKKDYFQIHSEVIERFLNGERSNNKICTTYSLAKKLERKFNITLKEVEEVDGKYGLAMFLIISK